jgi:group I intron endonuclease
MNNDNYIIYKAQNIVNNMIYIGATKYGLEARIADHIQKANIESGYQFQKAIGTYGPEAFVWEQLDTATTIDELAKKEINYILDYNSFYTGYNSDKGGGFKKSVYKYNLDGSLNSTYPDLNSAAISIKSTKQAVSRACWNVNHTLGGYFWTYEYHESFIPKSDVRKKPVTQYKLNGDIVSNFTSASEAARKTGVSKTCITRCCREEREQTGGFLWKYT